VATDILQLFLNRRLFDIGPDDTRLGRLRKAAAGLAASLSKRRARTVWYALAAFDPDVPPDDEVLGEAATAVQKHWNTYASCFADASPRPLFRAVLLEALYQAQMDDTGIATAVALVARNVLPHFNVASERDVWLQVVAAATERANEQARAEWDVHVESSDPETLVVEAEAGTVAEQPIESDRGTLLRAFVGAAGPTDQQGQPGTNPNPHWPYNSAANWSYQFAPRATEAVADAIDRAFALLHEQHAELAQSLTEIVRHHVSLGVSTVAAIARSTRGLQLRTELLWWKEAMYSPSTGKSYRAQSPILGAAQMALDLHRQVPVFCPESVEYFLREAAGTVFAAAAVARNPLRESINALVSGEDLGAFRAALRGFRQTSGRGPLVSLLADAFEDGAIGPKQCSAAIGIDGATEFTPADLSVWIFRELQALRATAASAGGAPKKTAAPAKPQVVSGV
jgi:GTPase-associated system helical domain